MAKLGDLLHIGRLERRLIAGPLPNPLTFSLILANLRDVGRSTPAGGFQPLGAS